MTASSGPSAADAGWTGADLVADLLHAGGVDRIFGNPGIYELAFQAAILRRDDMDYVFGLNEAVVMAMAEGYAVAKARAAVVSVHGSAGLGGLGSNLLNAAAHNTPVLLFTGQPPIRQRLHDPMFGYNQAELVASATKHQVDVTSCDQVVDGVRSALAAAVAPPAGPVLLTVGLDVLEGPAERVSLGGLDLDLRCVASSKDDVVATLLSAAPDDVAIICSNEVASSGALSHAVDLADSLGCAVFGAFHYDRTVFPTTHPLWQGMLAPTRAEQREQLAPYSVVFQLGGAVGYSYTFTAGSSIPPSATFIHLTSDASLLGRHTATDIGVLGDIAATLEAIVPLVRANASAEAVRAATETRSQAAIQRRQRLEASAAKRYETAPINIIAATHALASSLPDDAVLVDESESAGLFLRMYHSSKIAGGYHASHHASIGWGMPYAVGLKLAEPHRPVVCVVGDGSANFAIQTLYSAAKHGVAVVFAVLNNRQYRILKETFPLANAGLPDSSAVFGLDLDTPPIDFISLAKGYGVEAISARRADDLPDAVREAIGRNRPVLLDIAMQSK